MSDLSGGKEPTRYVAGFLFDPSMSLVALVLKEKPAWQAGLLNGIGGKVEPGESSLAAMIREFSEETGAQISSWRHYCSMFGVNNDGGSFAVDFYFAFGDPDSLVSMEREQINSFRTSRITAGWEKTIGNLPWLVALAVDCGKGSHPPGMVTAVYSSKK